MKGSEHITERRGVAYALFVVAGVLVMSPARKGVKDDFPLSPYAMFSENKDESTTVTHAVAIGQDGVATPLPPKMLGTDEVLQAKVTISNAVRAGKPALTALCAKLSERVAADAAWASAKRVEIRTVTYESVPYFDDPTKPPTKSRVHIKCEVAR